MTTYLLAAPPVRPATRVDVSRAARTLSVAFFDDPFARWMFPDDDRLEPAYAFYLERVWIPNGGVVMTDDGLSVATWMPPGTMFAGMLEQLRLLPALARVLGRDLPRILSAIGGMEEIHPREPHWYLATIGVVDALQGKGVGSRLIKYRLDRCDQDGLPAYLEATSERNVALYGRHGFEVRSEQRLSRNGPSYWPMWREPR